MNLGLGLKISSNKFLSLFASGFKTSLGSDVSDTPAAAYSLRTVVPTWFGRSLIEVRRSGDNAVKEFSEYEIESGIMEDWITSGGLAARDAFIATWYDQSGNGNHATQSGATEQPKIWDASTGLVTENGRPALDFDGVDDVLSVSGALYSQDINMFAVINILTTTSVQKTYYQRIIHLADGTNTYQITRANEDNNYQLISKNTEYNTGSDSLNWGSNNGQILLYARSNNTTDSDSIYIDSIEQSELGDNIGIGGGNNSPSTFGSRNDLVSTTFFEGSIQELIIYSTDQSANRTILETNINDYYDIF